MKTITEQKTLEVRSKCGVLVAGGGIAGIAAALAAARNGADVLLLEREYLLGGLGTAGLVTIYLPLCDGRGHQVSFGIAEELLRLSILHGAEGKYPSAWLDGDDLAARERQRFQVQYNPHFFAMDAERLLRENGVRILYGTLVADVHRTGARIDAVIVENKSGRYAIEVEQSVVDCTGDADICALAGEETVRFGQGNVLAAWYYFLSQSGLHLRALGACDVPENEKTPGRERQYLSPRRFTGLDGEEISEMVALSHQQTYRDLLARREKDASAVPVTLATIPQLRMTRRIAGVRTLDTSDCGVPFPDSVGMFGDWRRSGPVYHLPFSALYGRTVENLICAGRCISVSDAMWDITRVIPVCALSGQGAGTAAAMTGCFSAIDLDALRGRLTESGVRV